MNLEDLRAAQVDERGTDSLQPLPADFYERAADYLADLRARRDRLADQADDPFGSGSVRQLTDELETAEEVVEALYERRVGKLIKQASLAAAGMPADDEGLTAEERDLFGDLVDHIRANRASVLGVLEEGDATAVAAQVRDGGGRSAATGDDTESTAELAPAAPADPTSEPGPGASDAGAAGDDPAMDDAVERVTVRITTEVGEIYGVDDRVYTLGAEDVVTLPSANAQPLLDRGAAQRVD